MNNWRKCLVTGACGFVGRNVVSRLVRGGVMVVGVDDLSAGVEPSEWIDSDLFEFHHCDCREFFREGMVEDYDVVFHFAAVVGGRANIEGDPLAVGIDLSIDSEFVRWAVRNRPGQVVYASSSAAYPVQLQGREAHRALEESDIDFKDDEFGRPDQSYGWSKLSGEYLSTIAAREYDLNVAIIRPFSGYGESQALTYPLPAIAQRVAKRKNPLKVWGSGRQMRDFVYIDDVVDGIIEAALCIEDGRAVNLGSGTSRSFIEVAELFAEIAGYSPEIQTLPDRPEGVFARYADASYAEEILDWRATVSDREGFSRLLSKYE